jgi:hypothetical protein
MRMEHITPALSYGPFISRKQAQAQGLKQYFPGSTCKHGHVEPRLVSNCKCMECCRNAADAQYQVKKHDPEFVKQNRQKAADWAKANPEKVKARFSKMNAAVENCPRKRVGHRIRTLIKNQLTANGGRKAVKTEMLLGCTLPEAQAHLEAQFLPGMTWDNHGEWHIDHIRPCSSFDLTDLEQQKQCCHYTNLQPLWAADNLAKSDNWVAV